MRYACSNCGWESPERDGACGGCKLRSPRRVEVLDDTEESEAEMRVVFAGEESRYDEHEVVRPAGGRTYIRNSIFLAGPTRRWTSTYRGITEWRKEAIGLLKLWGFNGTLFVPEWRGEPVAFETQVEWETECLDLARCIMFWIPRSDDLPGLTTNDEWGHWKASGKCVLGIPPNTPNTRYQKWWADKLSVPLFTTLTDTCAAAANVASGKPAAS